MQCLSHQCRTGNLGSEQREALVLGAHQVRGCITTSAEYFMTSLSNKKWVRQSLPNEPMMTIATNVCYFGCQLVNELVVPLHKILLLALWPPEKNRTGRTLLHLPAGRREPQLRYCILLYYTVFTLDNRLYNRLYNRGCTTCWVNYTPTSCRGVPRKTNFRFSIHRIAFECQGYDQKCKCCAERRRTN